jgi:hypothetical protein
MTDADHNPVFTECCGSGMFIPYPPFFHPGSELSPSRIPDPHQRIKYFNPKKTNGFSKKYDLGCSSRIRMLTFYPSRIPDPGVKDTGYGFATLVFSYHFDADPDLASKNDADPDQQHCYYSPLCFICLFSGVSLIFWSSCLSRALAHAPRPSGLILF